MLVKLCGGSRVKRCDLAVCVPVVFCGKGWPVCEGDVESGKGGLVGRAMLCACERGRGGGNCARGGTSQVADPESIQRVGERMWSQRLNTLLSSWG